MSEGDAQELPRYKSHKTVWALEIETIQRLEEKMEYRLIFRDAGYSSIDVEAQMVSRYFPNPGDFYVVYADGYASFSPRKAFLEGYTKES